MHILVAESSPQNETAVRWTALERGFLAAVVLGAAAAMSPNQADPDLWGHVLYGVDALRDGLAPTATYTYTAQGYRWINHENLAEVTMALAALGGGGVGLLVLKFALSLVILGSITFWGLRQGRSLMPLCAGLVLSSINLAYWWAVRPQMFTFTFTALLLLLLSWCFEGWEGRWHWPWLRRLAREESRASDDVWFNARRLRWLWLAPALFLVWTNTHGGFVAGLAIFCAVLGLRAIEALLVRGRAAWGLVLRLSLMIAASLTVTLINPYSWRLHHWLFVSLGAPRPEIGEWHSLQLHAECFWPFALLAVTATVALVASRRPLDATHLIVLGLVTWQAVRHERHTAFVALLFGFWLLPHLDSALLRFGWATPMGHPGSGPPRGRRLLAAGLALALVALGFRLTQRLTDMPVNRDKWPVAAMQFIADRGLTGKLLVTFNWAQYAIAAVGPSSPAADDGLLVHFDGRYDTCYPFEIVDAHFDFILGDLGPAGRYRSANSGPIDGTRALLQAPPDVLLLSRKQSHSLDVVARHGQAWVLLYQDAVAQVWGRREIFDDPAHPKYMPIALRRISDDPQTGSATWPALPQRRTAGGLARVPAPSPSES